MARSSFMDAGIILRFRYELFGTDIGSTATRRCSTDVGYDSTRRCSTNIGYDATR